MDVNELKELIFSSQFPVVFARWLNHRDQSREHLAFTRQEI